jgi:large subunit ribosomal protein L28
MAKRCELTGKGAIKGSRIWRSGKPKKQGGIGTHITAITKRRFQPNLQRVKALVDGEVRYIRVATTALKKGLVVKAPKRTWKAPEKPAVKPAEKPVAKPAAKAAGKPAGKTGGKAA